MSKLQIIEQKLSELKLTLNNNSSGLSLVEYDILYGDIEELQYLVDELQEEVEYGQLLG